MAFMFTDWPLKDEMDSDVNAAFGILLNVVIAISSPFSPSAIFLEREKGKRQRWNYQQSLLRTVVVGFYCPRRTLCTLAVVLIPVVRLATSPRCTVECGLLVPWTRPSCHDGCLAGVVLNGFRFKFVCFCLLKYRDWHVLGSFYIPRIS
jgi:hypothetical protein